MTTQYWISDIIAATAHVVNLNTNNKHKDKPYVVK